MRWSLMLLGILGGWVPALALPGQQAPPTVRDEVVVTASLDGEERDQLPAAVEVVDAAEIEARQARTIADLLATVPGLAVVRSGSPGQVTSLFTRGTESDHTLVLWNGIELNDPYFGGFNWAFLPTDGVERVEIVRGPFSALYGGDAVGGVVQVLSGRRDGLALTLEGGGDGYARAGVAAGATLGRPGRPGSTRLDVFAHARRGDGRFDNDFFDGEEVVARLGWELAPEVSLGVVLRWNDSDTGIPFSGGAPSLARRIAWRERELALPFEAGVGRWRVQAALSRVDYESLFLDPEDPFGFTRSDTESEALRASAVASRRFGERGRISFGAEVERLEVTNDTVFGINLDGDRQTTRALFAETARRLGPVRLDLGVRYDDSTAYGGQASPKLGLSLPLTAGTRVWAAYGEGFRAPSIGELFFPFSGSEELEPERTRSVELGLERRAGSWRLTLAGFENRLTDLIDFDLATFRNVNVGRARTRGLEAAAAYSRGALTARAGAAYLETEDRDSGLELLRRPRHAASLVVGYRPGAWTLSATGRYVGSRADVDPATFARRRNGGFATLDLAVRRELSERFAPYLRLENAADRGYQEALGFPAPRRTLVGGLAIELR